MPKSKQAKQDHAATTETVGQEGVSKTEAIRQAIDKVGPDATLKQIQDLARQEYGLDISPSHISKIRSGLSTKKEEVPKAVAAARQEGISKTAAVKRALAKLGKKAMPAAIHDFVLSRFGMDLKLNHISNLKSTLKKAKKSAAEPTAVTHAGNGKAARDNERHTGGLSLADIEAAKQLAQQVGVEQLHALIDLVAK